VCKLLDFLHIHSCQSCLVILSKLCLPVAHWAGSFTLGCGAGDGGGCVFGLESQRGRVDAVAFSCGSWSIIKQVSQMSSTLAAGSLHSVHPIGEIIWQSDGLLLHKVKEGWPTWSWVKFSVRAEQWSPADNTSEGPLIFMMCELSCEGTLSSSLLGNMILHRCEAFPYLFLREAHWPCLLSPTCSQSVDLWEDCRTSELQADSWLLDAEDWSPTWLLEEGTPPTTRTKHPSARLQPRTGRRKAVEERDG